MGLDAMTIHNSKFLKNPVKYVTRQAVSMALGGATSGIGKWVLEYEGPREPATLRSAGTGDNFLRYADNTSVQLRS